jgi:hypothetical protein
MYCIDVNYWYVRVKKRGEHYHPVFLSCSMSKSIAKSRNSDPMMNMRSERAPRITNISVSFMRLR